MMDNKSILGILQLVIIIVNLSPVIETTPIHTTLKTIGNTTESNFMDFNISSGPNVEENPNRREYTVEVHHRRRHGIENAGRARRWSHRKRLGPTFSPWKPWSPCDPYCKQKRERLCNIRKRCGEMKHIEERSCPQSHCSPLIPNYHFSHPHYISKQDDHDDSDRDYFVVKKRPKIKPKKKKIIIELDDYEDFDSRQEEEEIDDEHFIAPVVHYKKNRKQQQKIRTRNLGRGRKGKRRKRYRKGHRIYTKKSFSWDRQLDEGDGGFDFTETEESNVDDDTASMFQSNMDEYQDATVKSKKDYDHLPKYENYSSIIQANSQNLNNNFMKSRNIPSEYFSSDTMEPNVDLFSKKSNRDSEDDSAEQSNRRWDSPNVNDDVSTSEVPNFFKRIENMALWNVTNNNSKDYRRKAVFEMPGRFRRLFSKWSKWTKCSAKCTTRRIKRCLVKDICGNEVIRETAYCYTDGSFCQTWIDNQIKKNQIINQKPIAHTTAVKPYHREPTTALQYNRRIGGTGETNAITNDFYSSALPYNRNFQSVPEYSPQNIKCGLPTIRNKPRQNNIFGMLRIIGGKTARRGQWPWQVVILNRFKEAFCGGTLVSPYWILTAAHCVRKKLFARLGEHHLEQHDGSEIEYRIESSIKHPKYDKRTVDNDVAMLRLPKEAIQSAFIGFACLPNSYQQLPKTHRCTIIGWGKRRNTDDAGTSLLHEAEVPIISHEECKKVYYDYTITKNMFCAGHKRGRIDTCAGDSGGPLLCRDTSQPDQPWTIFGITSFGDGCGKRNKFGIYVKLPNYVDWIWSVINCNGNCNTIFP